MASDNTNTTEMPALGRDCTLGMLYNQYTEQFVPGWSLWNQEKLQKGLVETVSDTMESTCIASDTLDKRAKALDLQGGLQISAISGLLGTRGSAKFLNRDAETAGKGNVAFKCRHVIKCVGLSMEHLNPLGIDHPEVFDKGIATHVVTQIQYGAQAFLEFSSDRHQEGTSKVRQGNVNTMIGSNTGNNTTAIQGNAATAKAIDDKADGAQAVLTDIERDMADTLDKSTSNGTGEAVSIESTASTANSEVEAKSDSILNALVKKMNFALNVEGGAENLDIGTNLMEQLQCQTFTDIAQSRAPTSYKEAVEFCKQFPKALHDNPEKARPLTVWLTPLSCLNTRTSAIQRGISDSLTEQSQKELEGLSIAERRCQSLLENHACKKFPGLYKECLQVQSYLQQYHEHFKLALSKVLPKEGESVKDLGEISAILETKKCSPFHGQILDLWFEYKENEIIFLEGITKEKVQIVDMHQVSGVPRVALVLHRPPLQQNSFLVELKDTS